MGDKTEGTSPASSLGQRVQHITTVAVMLGTGPGARQINLIFNREQEAQEVYSGIRKFFALRHDQRGTSIQVKDNYGTTLSINRDAFLEGIILQSSEKCLEGNIELSLLQARANLKANQRAQADPMLKLLGAVNVRGPGAGGLVS